MYDKVMIWNMALARLASSQQVSSETEVSSVANWCRLWHDHCLDAVLRDFDWPFAARRVVLASVGSPPTNWSYAYAYPSDCVKLRSLVVPGARQPYPEERYTYEIASNATTRVILTDIEQAEAIYTARITDPTLYDSTFVSALAANLASELAMPIKGKEDVANLARQQYLTALSQAAARAMNEQEFGAEPKSSYEVVRDGYVYEQSYRWF